MKKINKLHNKPENKKKYPTILIVDDQPVNIHALSRLFRDKYNIRVATGGKKALEIVSAGPPPDLILLDVQMPDIGGLEVLRSIRAMHAERQPYILMLTVRGEEEEIIEGLKAGANDYLARPFKTGELIARVEVGRRMVEMQDALVSRLEELRKALTEIKTLRGMLPICASCKKIRDDKGYWNQVEVYVRDNTEAEFSHSICPDCISILYPDLTRDDEEEL